MKNSDTSNPLFLEAVEAIDSGNMTLLKALLDRNPHLVAERLETPTEGYFKHPYLLWFVADNPIRIEKLPANIVGITRLLLDFVRIHAKESFQEQVNYTFGLVETGRIPRESGMQIELLDLLAENGAKFGDAHGALTHGNIDAAKHIIEKSGKLSLTAAICLDRTDDVTKILPAASADEKQVALIAAAFYGKAAMIDLLIDAGVDVNAYIQKGFHSHAPALHQAVYSGSIESVKKLVDAGASLDSTDRIYQGTPLGWAIHMQKEEGNEEKREKFKEIEIYLRAKASQ